MVRRRRAAITPVARILASADGSVKFHQELDQLVDLQPKQRRCLRRSVARQYNVHVDGNIDNCAVYTRSGDYLLMYGPNGNASPEFISSS